MAVQSFVATRRLENPDGQAMPVITRATLLWPVPGIKQASLRKLATPPLPPSARAVVGSTRSCLQSQHRFSAGERFHSCQTVS